MTGASWLIIIIIFMEDFIIIIIIIIIIIAQGANVAYAANFRKKTLTSIKKNIKH